MGVTADTVNNFSSPWMTVKQTAKYLTLSENQVRKMLDANKIPFHRLNPDMKRSKIYLHKRELDASIILGRNVLTSPPSSLEKRRIEYLLIDD